MPKFLILIIWIIGFLLGITAADFGGEKDFFRMFAVIFSIFFFAKYFQFWKGKIVFWIAIFLIGFLVGILRFSIALPGDEVRNFRVASVIINACVSAEVDVRETQIKYTVWTEEYGKILVNGPRYPVYNYGDCLEVSGKIERPALIDNFDYGQYLALRDIYFVIYSADLKKTGNIFEQGFFVKERFFREIYKLKSVFEKSINLIFGEPHAGFLQGLLLGSRQGISPDLSDNFKALGLTHIVAISGYNITLLILMINSLLGFLGRKRRIICALIIIFIFVILVGMGPSVVRAAIMGSISLLALWFGRKYDALISLLVTAAVMNLWNPQVLMHDAGFQLSFLATFGLIFLAPILEKYFMWIPKKYSLRETFLMSLAAQIMTLPIICANFGYFSLLSLFANILILPLIPIVMFLAFATIIVSLISNLGATLFSGVCFAVLELMFFIVETLSKLKFAYVEISFFNFWWGMAFYFGFFYLIRKKLFFL